VHRVVQYVLEDLERCPYRTDVRLLLSVVRRDDRLSDFPSPVVDLEVEARFTDPSGALISRHRGVGKGRTAQTIYTSNNRTTHQKAMRKALDDLNRSIGSDKELLEEARKIQSEP
jgi:hypothetical protein